MKKLLIVLLIVFTLTGMCSCTLIDGLFYPYIGTWTATLTETDPVMKVTTVFEKETFESTSQAQEGETWVDFMAIKGTVSAERENITTTPSHMKMAVYNSTTDEFELPAAWTALSSSEIADMAMVATWSITDNVMTVTVPDPGPYSLAEYVYTRVE